MKERLEQAEASVKHLLAGRNDRWYPLFHIAAPAGWINDPNGLCFFQGRYHVYFQHHPFSTVWGTMHWGHVSSQDMVTWRREPIAFAPSLEADRDGVFSGSAIVSDDGATQYVYYTGHRMANKALGNHADIQVQCLATSTDGNTFDKRGVIIDGPTEMSQFRDPKVWKIEDTWYMVVAASTEDKRGQIWLYTSPDMVTWAFDSVLYEDPNPDTWMAECPDMFPLGDKWVLAYCPMGPSVSGYANRNGYNTGYIVGEWAPGQEFVPVRDYTLGDWGRNFYAPQSFEAPDGRRIQYGWMGAFTHPLASQAQDGWSGQLTLPRELSINDSGVLLANPIEEIAQLRAATREWEAFELDRHGRLVLADDAQAAEIDIEVDLGGRGSGQRIDRFGLEVHKTADGAHSYVYYDDLAGCVGVDQRMTFAGERGYRAVPVGEVAPVGGAVLTSGTTPMGGAALANGTAPMGGAALVGGTAPANRAVSAGDNTIRLRIFIDRGSIEVFVGGGEATLSMFSFPGEGPRSIELVTENGPLAVKRLAFHTLGSMWEAPDRGVGE